MTYAIIQHVLVLFLLRKLIKQIDRTNHEWSGNIPPQIAKTGSNDFMQQIMDEVARKELSFIFPWNEQLLEKYQNLVDWKEVSNNDVMLWTASMLEKFKNQIDWDTLSQSHHRCILTAEIFEKFKVYWNWKELSSNSEVELDFDLIDRFLDRWDWKELIDSNRDDLLNHEFLDRYKIHIPVSELQNSRLWRNLVDERKWQLAREITA